MPELRSDPDKLKEFGTEVWKAVILHMVMNDDMPDANDPERDQKALEKMDELVKEVIQQVHDNTASSPAPGL